MSSHSTASAWIASAVSCRRYPAQTNIETHRFQTHGRANSQRSKGTDLQKTRLTQILGGFSMSRGIALDVCTASLHAVASGKDRTEIMRKQKVTKHVEFWARSWRMRMLCTDHSYGRAMGAKPPDTTGVLHALCRKAARRQGLADHLPLFARVRAAVAIVLARRSAHMVHACLRPPALLGWAAVRQCAWRRACYGLWGPRACARRSSV